MKKGVILIVLAFLASGIAIAQNEFENDDSSRGFGGFNNRSDTTKAKGGLKGGKLLDDSTKNIYGPTTSKYTFEKNIKYNQPQYYVIDTLIDNMHRFNYVNKNNNLYQDLGNIGTAITPIFYQTPSSIGVRSGIEVYDMYFMSADEIKYYDTHSPFTNMDITLGGNGRAITNVNYSRNISPTWNFGFDYKGLYVDKQIERSGKGDRNVLSNAYDLYTHYQTKNGKYQLLANISRNMHKVNEFGGVGVEDSSDLPSYFEDNVQRILQEASTEELRTNIHIYQQYKLSDMIQVYNQLDRYKQQNTFRDDLTVDGDYYGADTLLNADFTFDRGDFHTTTSEQGIKGDVGNLFYNFYHSARYYDMDYNNVKENTIYLNANSYEHYVGGRLRIQLDSLTSILGNLEYLLGSNYKIGGRFEAAKYSLGFRRMQYEPSYMEKYYSGNHHFWDNDFSPTSADTFDGSMTISLGKSRIKPFAKWTLLNDYIYYDTLANPNQVSDLQLMNVGIEWHTSLRDKLHFTGMGIYSSVEGNNREVMRVPELLLNTKVYYQNIVFEGNLQFQFGVDVHWKSSYYANSYSPAVQQYHNQDNFILPETLAVDIFANLKINRGRLFIKYINLAKAFNPTGYFASPLYIGQVNGIDFGFKWAFYD